MLPLHFTSLLTVQLNLRVAGAQFSRITSWFGKEFWPLGGRYKGDVMGSWKDESRLPVIGHLSPLPTERQGTKYKII